MTEISRQRTYQHAHKARGLCLSCSKPRAKGSAEYCEEHLRARRKRAREAAGCKAWVEGGRGRPPLTR